MAAIKLLNCLYVSQEVKAFTRVKTQKLINDRMMGSDHECLTFRDAYIFAFF